MADLAIKQGNLSLTERKHLIRRFSSKGAFEVEKNLGVFSASELAARMTSDLAYTVLGVGQLDAPYVQAMFDDGRGNDPDVHTKLTLFLHTLFPMTIRGVNSIAIQGFFAHLNYGVDNGYKAFILKAPYSLCGGGSNNLTLFSQSELPPNDNFARELLELMLLGAGEVESPGVYTNYTEQDIEVLAKLLTGLKYHQGVGEHMDPDLNASTAFHYRPHYNTEAKQFSDKLGNFFLPANGNFVSDWAAFINHIFSMRKVADLLALRMYQFFVNDTLIDEEYVNALADHIYTSDYDLLSAARKIMASAHFYENQHIGTKVMSPLDLIYFGVNYFGAQEHYLTLHPQTGPLHSMQMPYFGPKKVEGYDAYSQAPDWSFNWISADAKVYRAEHMDYLLSQRGWEFIWPYMEVNDLTQAVAKVMEVIFPKTPENDHVQYFKELALMGRSEDAHWTSGSVEDRKDIVQSTLKHIALSENINVF